MEASFPPVTHSPSNGEDTAVVRWADAAAHPDRDLGRSATSTVRRTEFCTDPMSPGWAGWAAPALVALLLGGLGLAVTETLLGLVKD